MDLEREEKKLEADIKKAAKQGQNQVATRLAKQLIQLRKQKARTTTVKSRVGSIGTQIKVSDANLTLAKAIGGATGVMKATNDNMDAEKMSNILRQFEEENMKLDMKDELSKCFFPLTVLLTFFFLVDETLDSILGDSEDEAESDQLVSKVLDEIGIEINQKISNAGTVPKDSLDVDQLLASLEPSSSKKSVKM